MSQDNWRVCLITSEAVKMEAKRPLTSQSCLILFPAFCAKYFPLDAIDVKSQRGHAWKFMLNLQGVS